MAVLFRVKDHAYESVNPEDKTKWLGITSFVSQFKNDFDAEGISKRVAKNKKSKWFGMEPDVIRKAWSDESHRALELGTWYHNQREADILSCETLRVEGTDVPVVRPIFEGSVKYAPDQRLLPGVYPEHMIYLKSAGICGQADRVEVANGVINLYDYKTNKEIKRESFRNWDGKKEMMKSPLEHLDDCNFNHYALQLSLYMYMMIKHNPLLKPGKLILHHILFEEDGSNQFGYPIARRDENGDPMVREVVVIELPYLRSEVISMINHRLDNN